jgi:diguanylate cyclase (GGDEF)-like protein
MVVKLDRGIVWFGLLVFAVLVASATAFLQTQFFIEQLVTTTNRAAVSRSEMLVNSAFKSMHTQLEKIAIDNSLWDDAVKHSYHTIDSEWLQTNWGATTAESTYAYDTTFVLDGMTNKVIAAFQAGAPYAASFEGLFGAQGQELLSAMPSDPNTSAVQSGFIVTERGLAIAAMSPIVPYKESLRIKTNRPNYLVLIKHLNPQTLADLGQRFLLENLTTEIANQHNKNEFKVAAGGTSIHPIAKWRIEVVDKGLRDALWKNAASGLAILIAILVGLAGTCWLCIQKVRANLDAALLDARLDPLTGLANRLALEEHVEKAARQDSGAFAIAFCDLDGFKRVNDTHGHSIGDELLVFTAQFITSCISKGDKVFRLGGDEFVVFFVGQNCAEKAIGFAKDAFALTRQPVHLLGRTIDFGMSIGITTSTHGTTFLEILRRADTAMYAAKNSEDSHWCRYEDIENLKQLRNLVSNGAGEEKELAAKQA